MVRCRAGEVGYALLAKLSCKSKNPRHEQMLGVWAPWEAAERQSLPPGWFWEGAKALCPVVGWTRSANRCRKQWHCMIIWWFELSGRREKKTPNPNICWYSWPGWIVQPPPALQEGALTRDSPTAAGGWLQPEVPWAGEGPAGFAPGEESCFWACSCWAKFLVCNQLHVTLLVLSSLRSDKSRFGQRLWELGREKNQMRKKAVQIAAVSCRCELLQILSTEKAGVCRPFAWAPFPAQDRETPSLPAHGDGAKLAKKLLPEMFGNWFTGCSSPGQGGQSDMESSQTLNQAAGFSSSPFSSYQDKQRVCVHTISLSLSSLSSSSVLSTPAHLQMPAKPLLPRLRASPAARQPLADPATGTFRETSATLRFPICRTFSSTFL